MSTPTEIFAKVSNGVAKLVLRRGAEMVGGGTGFLVNSGLITNSHVVRRAAFDSVQIHFSVRPSAEPIRLSRDAIEKSIRHESPENAQDFAFLALDEPEFKDRHRFRLGPDPVPAVGEQIVFLGYPFESPHLTAHVGYVSSAHQDAGVDVLQIDGSVNGGNSGGPLLRLADGAVAGIVTRAMTGLLHDQWSNVMKSFDANLKALEQGQGGISIGGVDPVEAARIGQTQMKLIATNLQRSANVGIGFAFSSRHVRNAITG
jgi:S1-C subfamily serine protease